MLESLKRSESIYPCTCSGRTSPVRRAPHTDEEGPAYPGSCSHRCVADAVALEDRPFAWRFRVPPGVIEWDDLCLGRVALDPRGWVETIPSRNQAGYSYQLAVVADDRVMGVNQVIAARPRAQHAPADTALSSGGLVRSQVRPRSSGDRNRRQTPGQMRRIPQARDLARACRRSSTPDRLPRSLVRRGAQAMPMLPGDAVGMFDLRSLSPEPWVVSREWLVAVMSSGF